MGLEILNKLTLTDKKELKELREKITEQVRELDNRIAVFQYQESLRQPKCGSMRSEISVEWSRSWKIGHQMESSGLKSRLVCQLVMNTPCIRDLSQTGVMWWNSKWKSLATPVNWARNAYITAAVVASPDGSEGKLREKHFRAFILVSAVSPSSHRGKKREEKHRTVGPASTKESMP